MSSGHDDTPMTMEGPYSTTAGGRLTFVAMGLALFASGLYAVMGDSGLSVRLLTVLVMAAVGLMILGCGFSIAYPRELTYMLVIYPMVAWGGFLAMLVIGKYYPNLGYVGLSLGVGVSLLALRKNEGTA